MGCWLQGWTCPWGWCFLRQLWVSDRGGSSSLGSGSPVGTAVDALCGICGSAPRSESPVGADVGSPAGAVGLDPAVGCLWQQEQVWPRGSRANPPPPPAMTIVVTFCSQIRPRPMSAQICQRAWGKPQAEGRCLHSPSRPASSDKACGHQMPARLLTPHQPALAGGRPTGQKRPRPHSQGRDMRLPGWDQSGGLGSPARGLHFSVNVQS